MRTMSKRHAYCSIALEELEDRVLMSQADAVAPAPAPFPWEAPLHNFYASEARQTSANVVFLGDSITFGWGDAAHPYVGTSTWDEQIAPLKAQNFGVPGDQTQNLVWRLQNGELAGQPKVAVVLIGTNNLYF